MTRIEAIKRLRELADKLEAATDGPGEDRIEVSLAVYAWESAAASRHWIETIGCDLRCSSGGSAWYKTTNCERGEVYVHCPTDYHHNVPADLLANREVTLIEIGGAA
jgi:hypothetical protein